jgi:hypothetical protein
LSTPKGHFKKSKSDPNPHHQKCIQPGISDLNFFKNIISARALIDPLLSPQIPRSQIVKLSTHQQILAWPPVPISAPITGVSLSYNLIDAIRGLSERQVSNNAEAAV